MVDEAREMKSFHDYYNEKKGTTDAVSIQATWLALKGACTVKDIPNGVRINGVTGKYPVYNVILQKYTERYKLSTEEREKKWKELVEYGKMKLGVGLSAK